MRTNLLLRYFLFLSLFIGNLYTVSGQTTLINATGDGGFETGNTFPLNGWILVNTPPAQINRWFCGNGATGFTGARCAHIGTAAGNNNYTMNTVSVTHFYRDIVFPAGQPNISLSFSYKGFGEAGWDYMRVYLVPITTTVTAGTSLTTGQVGGDFNQVSTWQNASLALPCATAGTTMRLVFSWINDASLGTNPGGAIDNISLISNTSGTCASLLGTGVTNVASLPYSSGAGTTCGQGNDITAGNSPACGSTLYTTGEDRVWVFTPTSTGPVNFNLSAPGASFTGLTLFAGCPVAQCSGPVGTCVAFIQDAAGDKSFCASLTAGVTYYLILDSWAAPACNAYTNLSITPVAGSPCATLLGTGVTNVAALPYNSGPGTTCGSANNLTATNMSVCGSTNYYTGEDQVWIFTPSSSGQVTINLAAPSASYTGLMLYSGCPVGACAPGTGTCVAFAQDFLGDKSLCVSVTAGTTYYLVLDSWAAPACNAYNSLSISAVATGLSGNTCATAVSIPALPYSVSGQTTACMGNDYTAGTAGICNGAFAFGEDKVYSFSVASPQCIGISLTSTSNNNITYSVYQGCPGGGGICIGSGGGATTNSLSGSVTLPAAGTYFLIIDTQNPSNVVNYNLQVSSFGTGAPNDMPFQATPIPFNIPIAGSNNCSGNADEPVAQPSCFQPAGTNTMNTVWYSFVAPGSGCVKMRTTLGTLTNTQIAVYGPVTGSIAAGSGASLVLVGCNQDQPPCGSNTYPTSQLTLSGLVAGSTYYIMVDGFASQTGTFSLFIIDAGPGCNINFPPTPGQDCIAAFPVCKTSISVPNPGPQAVGSVCEFTSFVNCLASGERGAYWYKINIVSNGFLEFTIVPNDWPGAPSTACTDYDFAVWRTKTAGVAGPANCTNLGSVAPISCNYSFLGVTGCFSATNGTAPAAYPGFGAAFQQRIAVTAGDEYLLNVSNFTNSTSGFVLNFSAGSPIATAPASGGSIVWTGTLSTDWYNPENWGGCAIPTCVYNVSIPSLPVNQPSITGLTAVCGSLDISLGSTLTMQAGSRLKICNNFVNNGTLNALAGSTIVMQSDSVVQNQSMSGAMTGINKFWHLIINKPVTAGGNSVTLLNDLDNEGNFDVSQSAPWLGGTFNATGRTHKVKGNFTVHYSSVPYGNYIPASILEFNGTASQNYFNRGTLLNVLMNHTGPGLVLGNSGAVDWMTIGGNLTLTQGKIITAANRVNVINSTPAAVSTGNNSSYVEGFLQRSFAASGGSYDFPVGTSLKGFQRFNYNFGAANDRTMATMSFVNTSPATPFPFLGPDCAVSTFDQATLNNGYWRVDPVPANGVSPYSVTAYNNNFTNPQPGYTVMTQSGSNPWALLGTCLVASPITATQRIGISAMGGPTFYAIAQALTPLPVELLYLQSRSNLSSISLEWVTASETNNRGFEIQRSLNPPDFNAIGFVDGAGTTTNNSTYEFEDKNVIENTIYYYRLKQVDFNGQHELTDIVYGKLLGKGFTMNAIPNPYIGSTSINLQLSYNSEVTLEILNLVGQVVSIPVNKTLVAGDYSYEFSAVKAGLSKGVYTIRLTIDGNISYMKLLELE